jgi:hypothetical protein
VSDRGGTARPWCKSIKEVTMDNPGTSGRDERFAARKALMDELARLRDQFSAGWLKLERAESFASAQPACR